MHRPRTWPAPGCPLLPFPGVRDDPASSAHVILQGAIGADAVQARWRWPVEFSGMAQSCNNPDMHRIRQITSLLLLGLMIWKPAQAVEVAVPEALRDWQNWVLEGQAYRRCPHYFNRPAVAPGDFACVWPGVLDLTVDAQGARFSQRWTLLGDHQWLPLPGDAVNWPLAVVANGKPAPVVMRDGRPSLWLEAGSYRIAGRFAWADPPGILALPRESGLLSLSVDGAAIAHPERTSEGVYLGQEQPEDRARNDLRVELYRLVEDDTPTRLTTLMIVSVAGEIREALLGPLLPAGFTPLAIIGDLPARFESDGQLRVQLQPGEWRINVKARAEDVLDAITLPAPAANLPDSEIWSYRANPEQRLTQAEGTVAVDPGRAGVPGAWQQLPAFRMAPGEPMRINEISRGLGDAGNELALDREMWLDFESSRFLAADRITGRMRQGWRLDMTPPHRLLSAREQGDSLLITLGAEAGQTGVELRQPDVDILTLAEAPPGGRIPVTGWDARFDRVDITLNLPPGYKLLAAPGADRAATSWVSQWRLLDFFLIAIITLGVGRLFGRAAGAVALPALALSYPEAGHSAWLWLNLLIAMALLRVAPVGWLRRSALIYQTLSGLALVLWLAPFVAGQLRLAVYPQLQPQESAWVARQFGLAGVDISPEFAMEPEAFSTAAEVASEPEFSSMSSAPASITMAPVAARETKPGAAQADARQAFVRYPPNAVLQTGPGIPDWRWNQHRLHWVGPVEADQTMRLMLAPRWLVTGLRFLEVFLLIALAALLASGIFKRRWTLPKRWLARPGRNSVSGVLLLAASGLLLAQAPPASADLPSPELLRELEERLSKPPECAPRCAEVTLAEVETGATTLTMRLDVHAHAAVALPLPGSETGWRPAAVLVNGSDAAAVLRSPDGRLWSRVPEGRHAIELSGPLPSADSLEIRFPAAPRIIEATGDGWQFSGIEDRRLLAGSLHLLRTHTAQGLPSAAPGLEGERLPTFVRIERHIEIDLDWRVTTRVTRIAPTEGAIALNIPLLQGESVTTSGVVSEDGHVLVAMSPTAESLSWASYLPQASSLLIEAPRGQPWQEVWQASVSGAWRAEFTGIPESGNSYGFADRRIAAFHPRPGERLRIEVRRPEPSIGQTLAFDAVSLSVQKARLSSAAHMTLDYRSTQGGQHLMRLPQGAELEKLIVDGAEEPFRADGRGLSLPILPGEHRIELDWRTPGSIGLKSATPAVDLGAPAANISLHMTLPDSRWLLATQGPPLGPAVLYWAELVALALIALILGRIGLTPLRTWHWLLLGLGLSTYSWPVLALVTAWLLICGARERWHAALPDLLFKGVQALIALVTVAALGALVVSLPAGLLGAPDTQVTGLASWGNSLNWFASHSASLLPVASAWSAPLWLYQALILAWALWLSFALLRWLPWVWRCFSIDGLWRRRSRAVTAD